MSIGFELGLTEEQQDMKAALHALARGELRARAAGAERDGVDLPALRSHVERHGLSPADSILADDVEPHAALVTLEELGYGDPGHAYALVPMLQVAAIVHACGTPAQRQQVAEALSSTTATASLLLYEDYGRQPSELASVARREGERWVLDGRKTSVSHPHGADVTLAVACVDGELAAFVTTSRPSGIRATRDDRTVGKIGLQGAATGTVELDGATFSDTERLLGGPALERAVGQARLMVAAVLLGAARATVEFCSGYAMHRTTWGVPLAERQAVSFPLIEHHTETEEVRLLVTDVAAQLRDLEDSAAIERKVARAVNRASSLGLRAGRDGVQLIGVRGITRDLPAERWYRDTAALAAIDFDVLQTPYGLN